MSLYYFLDQIKDKKYSKYNHIYSLLREITTRYGFKKKKYDKNIYKNEELDINIISFNTKDEILEAEFNLEKANFPSTDHKNILHNILKLPLLFSIKNKSILHFFETPLYNSFKKTKKILEPMNLKEVLYANNFNKKSNLIEEIKNYNKADVIIAHSPFIYKKLANDLFVHTDKIKIIPRAIDDIFFEPKKTNIKNFKLPENYFLFTGKITRYKNLHKLINMFNKNGENLVIAGDFDIRLESYHHSTSFLNTLKKAAKENIKFIAYADKEKLSDIIKNAKALIEPSSINDFPDSALEAQAGKIPVIASDIEAHRSVLGDSAIYFSTNYMKSLTEALELLNNNSAELIEKGIINSNKHKWDVVAPMYLELYKNII